MGGPMNCTTLFRTRRSVRGNKTDPVPRELIEEIVEVAKGAPSSMNSQPWHVHVLTGEPLEEVRRRNTELMLAGAKPNRDIHTTGPYEGVHRDPKSVGSGKNVTVRVKICGRRLLKKKKT